LDRGTLARRAGAEPLARPEGVARTRWNTPPRRPTSRRQPGTYRRSPLLRGAREAAALTGAEVASVLLPALVAVPLRSIAKELANRQGEPESGARYELHLSALAGRLLAPGGWSTAMRRASAEPWSTGRARPFDESTLRKSARAMSAKGVVALAENVLLEQVTTAVGSADVVAFTDLYDQVYWTKKPSWSGPIGARGNRCLACSYFGMTFVRAEQGPLLALHVSWHKPASPLLDALVALHEDRARHQWLGAHVRLHVLDRGTQGDPALRWAWEQGIPYLTLTRGHTHWRRWSDASTQTNSGVPVFVRRDERLKDCDQTNGRAQVPQVIVFPSRPEAGEDNGQSLRYRTAAELKPSELATLDEVYKARWPNNENAIKALVAVGLDRNLDRTLDPGSSRRADGAVRKATREVAAIDAKLDELGDRTVREAGKEYVKQLARREKKQEKLARAEATQAEQAAGEMGNRVDRGGEHLCKVLLLLLYNALSQLLHKSTLDAVRVLTPSRVRELLLGRSALGVLEAGSVTLYVESLPSPEDQQQLVELVRLFNEARLRGPSGLVRIRIRDPSADSPTMRI
jgi:hypothetical protein